jgi:signal transduction histidine kinase
MNFKILLIVILTGFIAAVHLLYTGSNAGFHVLHQQLFFIPLVLTSFWFGKKAGFFAAVVISLLYAPAMILMHQGTGSHLVVFTQVSLYLFVAFLMGWLSDRQRIQQEQLIKGERISTLGKAASTLSFEMRDIVNAIDGIYKKSEGLKKASANDEFLFEMDRLKRLLDALGQFAPSPQHIALSNDLKSPQHIALSNDLNHILQYSHSGFREEAARKRVKILLEPDTNGCPSTVSPEAISRIFGSLLANAIEFSKPGQSVILRSIRGGEKCVLEVVDSGPGVAQENESKLFTPFFTTNSDGYGLSLSAGRKVLRDLGGDLVYESRQNGGAIFRMIVPREHQEESIEKFAANNLST